MTGLEGTDSINIHQIPSVDKVTISHIPAMLTKDAQKAPKPTVKSKPTCARCKNHGKIVYRKGHSQNCEYLSCKCPQCHAIKMRNDSMAKCMSNERKSTIPKHMPGFAEADSSCSSTTPVMCSSAIKPEYHDTFDEPQTPDTTSYERPVKRLRTSPPTTDALSAVHAGYGYLQQDARATWGYDCLRQTVDPRYNIYPGMHFSGAHSKGMTPFPQPAAHTHASLEERKRLFDPAYKVATSTGRAAHPSASYQVNALLRSDSNPELMMHSSFRQLLQQISQPEDSGLNNTHKNI
ncbi:uncharacterized protein LOC134814161 isoform X4 [Bolinopsis microptera]|uniref:uncharacterized protein LOC134814161 isoform X4 n=1 Tax=Bolinopsis microptera TaxID=2820187 RepID=UPI00307987A8